MASDIPRSPLVDHVADNVAATFDGYPPEAGATMILSMLGA
jgi:hypothetical protein